MMYKAGLVAVIVANGKIVREMNSGGTSTVYLPFGCEYSIRFKNNENRRAAVTVSVDGDDVMNGRSFEWPSPFEHLEKSDSQTEDIGGAVDLLCSNLLGRHVRHRSGDPSCTSGEFLVG